MKCIDRGVSRKVLMIGVFGFSQVEHLVPIDFDDGGLTLERLGRPPSSKNFTMEELPSDLTKLDPGKL